MFRKIVLLIAATLFAISAFAAEVGGVKLDDKASVGGQELVLNGAGIRTRVFIKVYVGSLYVPAKAGDIAAVMAKGPRRVQLNLLRDLSPEQLSGALVDGLKDNNSEAELAAVKAQTDQLVSIMKGFGESRRATSSRCDFIDDATKVGLNGAMKGSISGEAFNRALTKVWLGDKPVQADLKKAMLGG